MTNNLWELWPYVLFLVLLPLALGPIGLALDAKLRGLAQTTVGAVYRAAIHCAQSMETDGLAWLQSAAGIEHRKALSEAAYDQLPANLGPVPIGLVKLVVSRDKFVAYVEQAFQEAVMLAHKLETTQV